MRKIIKLKTQRTVGASLAVRLGLANTPQQTATYLQALKAAKAKLARAKKTKVVAGQKRKAA